MTSLYFKDDLDCCFESQSKDSLESTVCCLHPEHTHPVSQGPDVSVGCGENASLIK